MFEPKNEIPMWEMVYDYIEKAELGQVISYADLEKVIGQDVRSFRQAVYKARKELLKNHNRFLIVERGVGYRVDDGMRIMKHAKGRTKIAKRQITKADFELTGIATKELTDEEKRTLRDFMLFNSNIRNAFKSNAKAIEVGIQATREQLVGAQSYVASAQVAQVFTDKQLQKLKELLGDE